MIEWIGTGVYKWDISNCKSKDSTGDTVTGMLWTLLIFPITKGHWKKNGRTTEKNKNILRAVESVKGNILI